MYTDVYTCIHMGSKCTFTYSFSVLTVRMELKIASRIPMYRLHYWMLIVILFYL